MSERASVFEGIQVGVESTPGTQVPAGKKLYSLEIDVDPMIPSEPVRPQGTKFSADVVNGKEWSEGTIKKGILAYNDIVYLLSSCLCRAAISTPTNNGVWTFDLSTASGGNYKTTFNAVSSANIAQSANAATIQAAMEAMSTVGTGNVLVAKVGTVVTVTFRAALDGTRLALTVDATGLTGPGSPYTVTPASTAASLTRRWLYVPVNAGPDTLDTLSVEKGSSAGASSFAFGHFDNLEISHTKKDATIKAKICGGALADGISMTGSPTDIPLRAVQPGDSSIYVGNSLLGMTQLTRCLEMKWGVKNRFSEVFTQDATQPSFSAVVEKGCEVTGQIVVEQDSVANQMMTDLRAHTQKFVRMISKGVLVESGFPYMIRVTMPFKYRTPKRGDKDDVYAGTYDLEAMYDATFGGGIEVIVECALAAL